jgi:hypothetical protein
MNSAIMISNSSEKAKLNIFIKGILNMGIYLTGVFIALIINLIIIINVFFTLISTKNRNIKQIGLHFNPWTGNYTKEKLTWKAFSLYIVYLLMISPLFSWLSVGWSVFIYLKGIFNKVPVPEKIKEINFKLSSVDLPKAKVKEYMNEIVKFYGDDYINLDDRILDEDDPDLLVIEPAIEKDDWYREIRLDRKIKNFTMYSHTPDYDAQFTDVYDYKFVGSDLWTRKIEHKGEFIGSGEEWDIKNNVVMELEVRNRMGESCLHYKPEDIEKKISSLKEVVEWQECKQNIIKYFVMFRHSDLFTEFELGKYMRSELERIKYGYKKIGI